MTRKFKISGIAALLLLAVNLFAATPQRLQPEMYQSEIASLVSTYLTFYHYRKTQLNDRVSKLILEEYLESLDPNRMFFLASDIQEFREKFENRLDNDLQSHQVNLEAPFFIFHRYKERVFERVDANLAYLKQDVDFSRDEFHYYDRTEAPWAQTSAQLDELWRLRLKEQMVRYELREQAREEYMETLEKRYKRMRRNVTEWEPPDVLERFLASLSEIYDPHSSYLKPATKDNFDIQMGHSLEGIGATLIRDGEYTRVVEVVKGGPADRGGELQANDKIIAVAQGDEDSEDVVDLRLDKVVKKIRGPKGSKVRLTVIPADAADQSETREIIIIRDHVEITQADAKSEIQEIPGADGKTYRVGVINIPSFYMDSEAKFKNDPNYKSTTRDVRKLLKELEKEKIDGLVVDLRENGGGSLDEAIQLTGLFIDEGPVVQIKDHKGNIRVEDDPDSRMVYDGPLLVLTSVFSASASEIFASAIQDYDRGLVVGGETTHGKGTVQNIIGLQGSLSRILQKDLQENVAGALKLTTHKFYRISGGSTQFKGVRADIALPSPFDGMDVTEEHLDNPLPWDEIDPVVHQRYNRVRDALTFLKRNSSKRVADNPEFQYVQEDVAMRKKQDEENRVSLNLEKRRKEMKDLEDKNNKRKEERKLRLAEVPPPEVSEDAESVAKNDGDDADTETKEDAVPIPDFILKEAVFILRDFIEFEGSRVALINSGKKESL